MSEAVYILTWLPSCWFRCLAVRVMGYLRAREDLLEKGKKKGCFVFSIRGLMI